MPTPTQSVIQSKNALIDTWTVTTVASGRKLAKLALRHLDGGVTPATMRHENRETTMANVTISEAIAAPAEQVWALIRDFGSIADWLPAAEASEADGSGVGAIRSLALAGGASARERLEVFDDAARSYTYTVIDSTLPMTGYRATIRVEDAGAETCTLHWSSAFDPVGVPEAELAKQIEDSYLGGVASLRERLAG